MTKFLNHIFIIILLFVLFIIIFKEYFLKEGNIDELLEEAKMLRSRATDFQNKSQEFQTFANENLRLATVYMNLAIEDESNAQFERNLEEEIRARAFKNEQELMLAEEIRNREIINEEVHQRKIKEEAEYNYQRLQNDYQEVKSYIDTIQHSLDDINNQIQDRVNVFNQYDIQIQDLITQSLQARERNQPYWNNYADHLYNLAQNIRLEQTDNQYYYDTLIFKRNNIMNELNDANNTLASIKEQIPNI